MGTTLAFVFALAFARSAAQPFGAGGEESTGLGMAAGPLDEEGDVATAARFGGFVSSKEELSLSKASGGVVGAHESLGYTTPGSRGAKASGGVPGCAFGGVSG